MEQIYWNKLNIFGKIAFVFGWLGVLNLVFWIAMIIIHSYTKNKYKNFFNPETFKVVYVFGWIYLMIFAIFIIVLLWLILILGIF